jgi:hypothetical protein
MKKTLLMAAVLVLAACGKKGSEAAPAADTSAVAPAPAPADTGMMSHDTGMTHSDTTMARDSMHQ